MSENASARRVVLLARPGPARDRMREALAEASAVVVLEADPTVTDPSEVSAARPDVALIVLDAATDEALERFDALLSDPGVEVLFEEAELAVGRAGWDAARWVRHLAAKLHRSGNVLPPGQEAATDTPVPSAPVATPSMAPDTAAATPAPTPEWSLSDLQVPELPAQPAEAVGDAGTRVVMPELETTAFDMPELPSSGLPGQAQAAPRGFESTFDVHGELPSLETEALNLAPLQLDEEFLATSGDRVEPLDLQLDIEPMMSAIDADATPPPPPLPNRFELELVEDTPAALELEDASTAIDEPAGAERFQNDLADLHNRIASMELVVDRPATQVRGAVLVLAGIGGPDAVRQLLGALPGKFPRAVLVQQRLDGGHYDKLVAQMQRATQLLVELAVPGRPLEPASVYILPPTVGVETRAGGGLSFTDDPGDLLASLPAGDSAVLMLSGSDPNQVDAVMKLSVEGALVAAQALDGCYDVAAPAALASRGGTVAKPQDLARRLAERWDH